MYRLSLSPGEPFVAIGSEGGFFPKPIELDSFILSPSERIGVVIDFSKYPIGTKIVLRNTFDDVPGDPFDEEKTREIMRFDVVDNVLDRSRIPADLPVGEMPGEDAAVRTRDWRFERSDGAWVINERCQSPLGLRIRSRPASSSRPRSRSLLWRYGIMARFRGCGRLPDG